MQVHIIVATFLAQPGAAPVIGAGTSFSKALDHINVRLARKGSWINLNLPEGDSSVIRSTGLGQIRFDMERVDV